VAIHAFMRLAHTYGPIYRLTLSGGDLVIVSSQELLDELCDETRFDKAIDGAVAGLGCVVRLRCRAPWTGRRGWTRCGVQLRGLGPCP